MYTLFFRYRLIEFVLESFEPTPILTRYGDVKAYQPVKDIDDATPTLEKYVNYLTDELQHLDLCSRVEHTGSVWDGVKVPNDIEFDVMMIKTEENIQAMQAFNPGYYHLQDDNGDPVSPKRKVNKFHGDLQILINRHPDMPRLVKLRYHGPAVQMDVYRDETDKRRDNVWYSVDVVLSYEVKLQRRKRIFVAKDLESEPETWRISYSLEEKALFNGMDDDDGCRKKVLRILKAWRNDEVAMHPLTSYHLKTALFHEMKESRNWSQSELGPRVIGVLGRLQRAMEEGNQPHYFEPRINLLSRIGDQTIADIGHRLERICTCERVFTDVFEVIIKECARYDNAVELPSSSSCSGDSGSTDVCARVCAFACKFLLYVFIIQCFISFTSVYIPHPVR